MKFWKITPLVALGAAVALLVAGLVMAAFVNRAYDAQKMREVDTQARILASTITAALAFNDAVTAREYVDALAANPEVRIAAVYDVTGTLFASYVALRGDSAPAQVSVGPPRLERGRVVAVQPVVQGGTNLGSVYLATLAEPLAQRVSRWSGIALLIVMGSLLVGVLGVAHLALNRANAELERRAAELAAANAELLSQIAEREKAEAALRQSQKMEAIGQLSGGIAHDFNNILMVARGHLQMLSRRVREGRTDVVGYIDPAMAALDRAATLTQRILAFSRRQTLEPKALDLNALIEDILLLLRTSLGGRIALETKLDATWAALCDESQMENVLLNLAINARDAMAGEGRLTIETGNLHVDDALAEFEGASPGDYVRLSVTDTGAGMTEEVRSRAIDPFFTTKPEGRGTGLGLSTIFGYVRQSNGAMKIDSAPGKGTTVTILMPRDQLATELSARTLPPIAASARAAQTEAAPRAPTVLMVEDEILARMLAVETLKGEGLEVLEEGNGAAAHTLLKSDAKIDVLISDIRLPGMNGYELAAAGMAERPDLKVLLVTGYAQTAMPEPLVRAGVTVLYKPYDLDEFVRRVRALLAA
jgi:signal transduction histidine kinase